MVQELALLSSEGLEEVEWEDAPIVPHLLDLTTRVATDLDVDLKKQLITCLTDHRNFFA